MCDPFDVVDTAYGRLHRQALMQARTSFDPALLLRCIEDMREMTVYLEAEGGLRDAMQRLYCIASTLLLESGVIVPPDEVSLEELLRTVREDLSDAHEFINSCITAIAPLQGLPTAESPRAAG